MVSDRLKELWRRFKHSGDLKSRELLISNYSYLVKITAGRVAGGVPASLDREDIISAGTIGLIRAVDQFDFSREVKFETYAIALIRGAILELLRGEDWAPRSIRDKVRQLERAYADTELRLGRPGSDDEVAAVLGVGVDAFHKMLAEVAQASVLSLDETLFSGDGESTVRVVDTVEDAHASADTNRQVERRERNETLGQAIDRLPEREKHVLSLYYYQGMTFKEIGRILKVSESRVFQLHQQATMRLRGYLSVDRELFQV